MIRTVLRRLRATTTVLYECRNCGTSIEDDRETCPACGADEVAEYDLSQS